MRGLDTNVLLRLILSDDAAQAGRADGFVEVSCSADDPCWINRIVLVETAWVLQSGYGYSRQDVATIIENILRTEIFTVENAAEAWSATKSYRESGADFADCLIGTINRAQGFAETVTFDRAAAKLDQFIGV
jgi:predicted nucleic-acid-binding protein